MSTNTSTNTTKTRTITLTGRRAVLIREHEWPIIAEAEDRAWDNQYESQANRSARRQLIVRQHEDGRTIVYGYQDYSSQYQGERNHVVRRGVLLNAGDDIPAAIHTVARQIDEDAPAIARLELASWRQIAEECIADLPAEEL